MKEAEKISHGLDLMMKNMEGHEEGKYRGPIAPREMFVSEKDAGPGVASPRKKVVPALSEISQEVDLMMRNMKGHDDTKHHGTRHIPKVAPDSGSHVRAVFPKTAKILLLLLLRG